MEGDQTRRDAAEEAIGMARMYVEGEFTAPESEREAAARLMAVLDESAAQHGMVIHGDVEIAASETSLFAVPRTMRLEADVVTR